MTGVGFAVGTGRCGTKFLAEVFARDPDIASHHERHPFNDTFHRYCRWYNIDVDDAGFLAVKRQAIEQDLRGHRYSFEASGFLSLSLEALHRKLGAKFVVMVRRPDRVVASYLRKGWYENAAVIDDPERPPSMQNVVAPHHFLGRTMPAGAEFERWSTLTRVGKIAWYWSRLNRELLAQASRLPPETACMQKLEALDYAAFRDVAAFLGAPANVTEMEFASVRGRRPNASLGMRTVHDWTKTERAEFEAETGELADRLGYTWEVEKLVREPAPAPAAPTLKQMLAPLLDFRIDASRPT